MAATDAQSNPASALSPCAARDNLTNWLSAQRQRVDGVISDHLQRLVARGGPHSTLMAAVEYSMKLPGKRLRPILALESCRACGGSETAALPAALAVECIHTFSLIHDDLPAMDDDDLRRGQPTSHKVFGEAQAILAGDWLAVHAFDILAASGAGDSGVRIAELAAGTQAMIAGQSADIEGEQSPPREETLDFIHANKTAALIRSSCRLGALSAGAASEPLAALSRYGTSLGLAFQIVDDILDATANTQALGKRASKDAGRRKQTFPALFGLAESRRRAERHIEAAVAALDIFGPGADNLRNLAHFVLTRQA